jgi:hypothetical protein
MADHANNLSIGQDVAGVARVLSAPPLTFLIPSHFSITSPFMQTGSSIAFFSLYITSALLIHFNDFKPTIPV